MNLVWHIVKKDLRALRWPLVVWVALISAKLAMGVLLLTTSTPGEEELFQTLDGLAKMLAGAECLGVVLVAALIQEDLLVGTTAFWATRPISGGRLLAAKLLTLGIIFGVLPVLVTVPWWLACHLSFTTMLAAATETLALQFLVVVLGLVCAVVTDSLGRFFLWTLAFLAAIPLTGAIVAYTLNRMNAVVPPDLGTTRVVLGLGVAGLIIAAVVTHQFLTRRTWRSIGMIGAGIAVVMAIELLWPWAWGLDASWNRMLARRAEEAWPAGATPAGLTFTVDNAEIRGRADKRTDRPMQLWVNCRADGLPSGQMLVPAANSYTLRWADGVTDEGWSWFNYDRSFLSLIAPRTPDALAEAKPSFHFRATQSLPAKLAVRLVKEPAAYTLAARFTVVEAGTRERVPSAPGARIMSGMAGERIAAVEKDGEEMAVTFVRSRPALVSDYLAQLSSYVLGAGQGMAPQAQYVLMNRAGEILDAGNSAGTRTSRVGGVEVSWETKTYRAMKPGAASKPRWEAIKALEEAELTRVTYRSDGSFTHTLKVDPLVATVRLTD